MVPFFLNRADYVGFFLKVNPHENNFSTFVIKKKDFDSQSEFMQSLAVIYDSASSDYPINHSPHLIYSFFLH